MESFTPSAGLALTHNKQLTWQTHFRKFVMPEPFAIDTHELRKVFGEQVAVKGLTLQVKQGEVFGFLGPNGAGKTTSIKMLLGLVAPTSGNASLLGAPIRDRNMLRHMGFLPEHFRFQEWLTAEEFLELHGQLYGMQDRDLKSRINELLERVGLSDFVKSCCILFPKECCNASDSHKLY